MVGEVWRDCEAPDRGNKENFLRTAKGKWLVAFPNLLSGKWSALSGKWSAFWEMVCGEMVAVVAVRAFLESFEMSVTEETT